MSVRAVNGVANAFLPETPIPEPATLILLGSGLAAARCAIQAHEEPPLA